MTTARVELWGTPIGAVRWDAERKLGFFQYEPGFLPSGIRVAPLTMPLEPRIQSFPGLNPVTFQGLPGLLADSLPDRFGNTLIDAWLRSQGRAPADFSPVERLTYQGTRGMGALEFRPALGGIASPSHRLDVAALVRLANLVLGERETFETSLAAGETTRAMRDILQVGTSAGGARAKAVIAWNPESGEVRSGQVEVEPGFSHWLIKFDGVSGNRDHELADPLGFGLVEYAYHRMALAAGIEMNECRLLHEGGRSHFVTRRFDRTDEGKKLHMQSLGAIAHLDFNQPGAHSYEEAFAVLRQLELPMDAVEELYRRMAFNIVARNHDDHVKNIAFLMDRRGAWTLSPAFDLTFSYNPDGFWTGSHQMTLGGKRDGFERDDFEACARQVSLLRGRGTELVAEVQAAAARWPEFASEAGVPEAMARAIGATFRRPLDPRA